MAIAETYRSGGVGSLAERVALSKPSALQEALILAARPGILSFGLGLPAEDLFPVAAIAAASAAVLNGSGQILQYQPPQEHLRHHIVKLMAERGVACTPEQIFLTAGAQQGMALLARLFLGHGGTILTEEFVYSGFQQAVAPLAPTYLTVGTDPATGIDVDAVARHLEAGARPALLYVIADGHNPLGVSMSLTKREHLAALARQYGVPIIEDDAYGFLSYSAQPLPALRSFDDQWICYIGSFAKILAPALRVGWLVVAPDLIPALSVVKEASDINTTTLTQRIVAAYLDRNDLLEHLAAVRAAYRVRRDCMIAALQAHFPPSSAWSVPTSGLFLWVALPEGIHAGDLLQTAVSSAGVAFIPGYAFQVTSHQRSGRYLRLNFSRCTIEKIATGIARLGGIVRGIMHH